MFTPNYNHFIVKPGSTTLREFLTFCAETTPRLISNTSLEFGNLMMYSPVQVSATFAIMDGDNINIQRLNLVDVFSDGHELMFGLVGISTIGGVGGGVTNTRVLERNVAVEINDVNLAKDLYEVLKDA